jgi:predicted transcriptional regulator
VTGKTDRDGWKGQLSKRPERRGKMITTRLPTSLVDAVDGIAKDNDTTRTAIVQHQLERFVDENRSAPEPPVKTGLFE